MKRVLSLSAAITLSAFFQAEASVEIRSGEHSGFSRLVMYFDDAPDWTLGRTQSGYALELADDSAEFDTSSVFEFIPKSRILAVDASPGSLNMEVNCDCHAEAFPHTEKILVIDIKDGPPTSDSGFERRLDEAAQKPATSVTVSSPIGVEGPNQSRSLRFPVIFPSSEQKKPLVENLSINAETDEDLKRALAQGLGYAATEGLAEISRVSPSNPEPESASVGLQALPTVQLRTGFSISDDRLTASAANPEACLPDKFFDFAPLSDPQDAYQRLSAARETVLKEIGGPLPGDVLKLARIYAELGFGAEIHSLFAAYPQSGEEASVLLEIAKLLDEPTSVGPALLQSQATCNGAGALWGFLALPASAPRPDLNFDAIVRTISGLPIGLRQHLVPTVSDKLREFGQPEAASQVRESVLRAVSQPQDDLAIEVALADEADDTQNSRLEIVAESNSESALRARTELLRRNAKRGLVLTADDRDEIEGMIYEAKGSPQGDDLLEAYLHDLARLGHYDEAMAYLHRMSRSAWIDGSFVGRAADQLYKSVVETSDDGRFLVFATEHGPESAAADLSQTTRELVSDRLTLLGFPALAARFAPQRSESYDPEKQRILAASALSDGRPMEALARIARLEDSQSRVLRAEALVKSGAFGEASDLLAEIGSTDRAATLSWMGEDWQAASRSLPDGPRRKLAQQIEKLNVRETSDAQDGPSRPGPFGEIGSGSLPLSLEETMTLIETSESIRRSAGALVNSAAY